MKLKDRIRSWLLKFLKIDEKLLNQKIDINKIINDQGLNIYSTISTINQRHVATNYKFNKKYKDMVRHTKNFSDKADMLHKTVESVVEIGLDVVREPSGN